MIGQIVGAAVVSHHPGLMQCEEFRVLQGAGQDSDLIAGYARLRQKIVDAAPQVVMVFDSHWFTTGYHLVDAGERYSGTYISDEMPWYLHGVPFAYRGHPKLARALETASRARQGYVRVIDHPDLGRHYATVNLVKHLVDGPNGKQLDHAKLKKTIATAMRMLDNVIDINYYAVKKARDSNLRHRPVGMGLMAFQDALYEMRIPYASEAAVAFEIGRAHV